MRNVTPLRMVVNTTAPRNTKPKRHRKARRSSSSWLTVDEVVSCFGGDEPYWRSQIDAGHLWARTINGDEVVPVRTLADFLRRHGSTIPARSATAIERFVRQQEARHLMSNHQLMKMNASIEWIIKGSLATQYVALLVGMPHLGKSYLVLDLAIAVAGYGERFLRHPIHKHGPVLIVTSQDKERRLKKRMRELTRGRKISATTAKELPIYFHVLRTPLNMLDEKDAAQLRTKVASIRRTATIW